MGAAISRSANALQPTPRVGLEGGLAAGRLATAIPSRGVQEIAGQRQASQDSAALQDEANGGRPGPGEIAEAGQGDILQRVGAPQGQEGVQTQLAIGANGAFGVLPDALAAAEEFATQTRQQTPTPSPLSIIPQAAPQAEVYSTPAGGNVAEQAAGSFLDLLA